MMLLQLTGVIWTAFSALSLRQSSMRLHICERLGAELILEATVGVSMSSFLLTL